MNGWLSVLYKQRKNSREEKSWDLSVQYAMEKEWQQILPLRPSGGMISWSDQKGSFPGSGVIYQDNENKPLAWLGRAWDDSGDASRKVREALVLGRFSDEFLQSVNGEYATSVYSHDNDEMTVVTDRFNHFPVYALNSKEYAVFSTEIYPILFWLAERKISKNHLDLFLRTGELIDQVTLVEGINILPSASVTTVSKDQQNNKKYWSLEFLADEEIDIERAAKRSASLMQQAVQRIESLGDALAVPLSGGLDSRLLLGLLQRPEKTNSWTWGLQGCRDRVFASQFAQSMGSNHHDLDWPIPQYPLLWEKGVRATSACMGISDMHVLPFAEKIAESSQCILNGLSGDALIGGNFQKREWLHLKNQAEIAEALWNWRVSSTQDDRVDQLLGTDGQNLSAGKKLWLESIEKESWNGSAETSTAWLLKNRVFRWTNGGTMILRGAVESYSPFFDRDLVNFMLRVPIRFLPRHRLYLKMLRYLPKPIRDVKWQRTGLKPAWGYGFNVGAIYFQKAMTMIGKKLNIKVFKDNSVADVPEWMRSVWKNDIQRILFEGSFLKTGYISTDVMKEIWNQHLIGEDYSKLVGTLITLEYLQRMIEEVDRKWGEESNSQSTIGCGKDERN